MISKIKLKIHVLSNKALFISLSFSISLSLSLSFVFFLFLNMICKYGSHNSPLNNNRSNEIYGWSFARAGFGVVRVYGPCEVRTNHPIASVTLSSVPVRVGMSYESMARWKSVRNHSHETPEQFTGPIRVSN